LLITVDSIVYEKPFRILSYKFKCSPEEESADEKIKRQAAEWRGDCSFEAENEGDANWQQHLSAQFGISQLFDASG